MFKAVFFVICVSVLNTVATHALDTYEVMLSLMDGGQSVPTLRPTQALHPIQSFETFYQSSQKNLKSTESLKQLCAQVNPLTSNAPSTPMDGMREIDKNTQNIHKVTPEVMNVLCFDGGGVRAIATLTLLCQLEIKTGKKTYELFDRLYGTSTGGIAALLFSFGYSAPQVLDIYFDHMHDVFYRPFISKLVNPLGLIASNFSNEGLKKIINTYMHPIALTAIQSGQSLKEVHALMDAYQKQGHTLDSTILLKDAHVPVAVVSKNYATHGTVVLSSEDPLTHNNLVLHAALATSAAPTYFPAVDVMVGGEIITCIDGGVSANNPSMVGLEDILMHRYHMDPKDVYNESKRKNIHILSLGTGKVRSDPLHRNTGKLGFINVAEIPNYFMDSAAASVDSDVRKIAALMDYITYTRVTFDLPERIELSDTSDEAKKILQQAAVKVILDKNGDFSMYVKDREHERRMAYSEVALNQNKNNTHFVGV